MDQVTFEERLRFMFGISGYVMFTVDKVVGAIVKQVCSHLAFSLFLSFAVVIDEDWIDPSYYYGCEESGFDDPFAEGTTDGECEYAISD